MLQSSQGEQNFALFIWFALQVCSSFLRNCSSSVGYVGREGFHWSGELLEDSFAGWIFLFSQRAEPCVVFPPLLPLRGFSGPGWLQLGGFPLYSGLLAGFELLWLVIFFCPIISTNYTCSCQATWYDFEFGNYGFWTYTELLQLYPVSVNTWTCR